MILSYAPHHFLFNMLIPAFVNQILEMMFIPALIARLLCNNRTFKDMKWEQLLDAALSITNICLLVSLVVIEKITNDENCEKEFQFLFTLKANNTTTQRPVYFTYHCWFVSILI